MRRRAPSTAARRAARAPTARARASTTTCSPRTTPTSSGAPPSLRGNTAAARNFAPRNSPDGAARTPARPPTPAHARPPTPAPARSRRYPRFGDLQGTKGNAERSAAIPGASQFIFGYLALLTELSRVCEGAPPNVVLHNFDVTPLTILGIASPLNL